MDALGINTGLLFAQLIPVVIIVLPIIALIDLARRKLKGTPLAIWVLIICAIPLLGAVAFWIVKPTAEGNA